MIEIRFMRGSAYIDVVLDGRVMKFTSPMLNFVPYTIDLNKLDEPETKKRLKKMNADNKMLKELSKLSNEDEMADDLIDDMKQSGWEVTKVWR